MKFCGGAYVMAGDSKWREEEEENDCPFSQFKVPPPTRPVRVALDGAHDSSDGAAAGGGGGGGGQQQQLRKASGSSSQQQQQKQQEHDQQQLKPFLRNLVYKANFLVEENLNLLVEADDILEDERSLFRLDSILATIGVEEEAEIAAVLDKHRANPNRAKMEILKVIRGHIEKVDTKQILGGSSSSSCSSDR